MTRATDLPNYARAFLDAVAVGEAAGANDDAGYSLLFGGGHFLWSDDALVVLPPGTAIAQPVAAWPPAFPDWGGVIFNGQHTTAAGRYQFEKATYTTTLGGGPFDPVTQDHQAWTLAVKTRLTLAADLQRGDQATLQAIAGNPLNLQWTSLSPATFPDRYRAALAALP